MKLKSYCQLPDHRHHFSKRLWGCNLMLSALKASKVSIVGSCIPKDWYQCDALQIYPNGQCAEFEMKVGLTDYKGDFRKHGGEKHWRLKLGLCVPNYFWYVTPKDLIPLVTLPNYAGLLECWMGKRGLRVDITKAAPRLHGHKLDKQEMKRLLKKGGYE